MRPKPSDDPLLVRQEPYRHKATAMPSSSVRINASAMTQTVVVDGRDTRVADENALVPDKSYSKWDSYESAGCGTISAVLTIGDAVDSTLVGSLPP